MALLGEHSLNVAKQGIEGTPENCRHVFGAVADCVDREICTPWSKVVKLAGLLGEFVNTPGGTFDYGVATQVRGVTFASMSFVPGVTRMLLPRLDVMAGDAARTHPTLVTAPKGYVASPRLKGEKSDEEAWERVRRVWNFVLRLALIDQGQLFRAKFEAVLPMSLRLTFPGKEPSSSFRQAVMDASGTKVFAVIINPAAGTIWYIREEFTEEENECFNNFDAGREADCTTINHREHVALDWLVTGPGVLHPGSIIDAAIESSITQRLKP